MQGHQFQPDQGEAEVAVCTEDQHLQVFLGDGARYSFQGKDVLEMGPHQVPVDGEEVERDAAGTDRVDDGTHGVGNEDEPAGAAVLFHDPAQGCLGVLGQVTRTVKDDQPEGGGEGF